MTTSYQTSAGLCELCGSSLGRGPARRNLAGRELSFCCAGCLNVYLILIESGAAKPGQDLKETDLFRQSQRLGLIARPDRPEPAPDFPVDGTVPEVKERLYQVNGMWCASCAWLIEQVLNASPGIRSAEVYFASDLLRVRYYPQYLKPGDVERRLARIGYRCSEYSGQKESDRAERRDLLLRIGVAGFIWLNIMYLSMVFYVGYFERIADSARRFLPFVLAVVSSPAVFYSAFPILRIAWLGARERVVRMETLLALGILSAWLYSTIQAFRGGSHYYFDTACAIVTLVLAGKLIERGARAKTAQSISLLYRMAPNKARVIQGEQERFIPVTELMPGTIFTVKPGEALPADGIVVEGSSHVDESVLTGEPAPQPKDPGSAVICGSISTGGLMKIRATRTGADTSLSRIIGLVEKAMSSRSELDRLADRISRVFVPAVIALAVLTFGAGLFFEESGAALMRAITVLVVACPCALGVATPLAATAAVGVASQRGILVSDTRFLETVGRLDAVVLDKTGTVTCGKFRLVGFALPDLEGATALNLFLSEHLSLIASLERYSEHPLGLAVARHAAENGIDLSEATDLEVEPGKGIRGQVGNRRAFVGSAAFMEVRTGTMPASLAKKATTWAREGRTIAWYGWDGAIRGILAFGDSLKPEAAGVVGALKRSGLRVWIVSGDSADATAFAAAALVADEYRAGCLPGDKERLIRELQAQGKVVAMVGDGVNDAPALALADLGIAMGTGTGIAMRAAPVTLMSSDLGRIPETFALARTTVRIVRQNMFWAFFYNLAGITLAVTGVLNPIAAAAAMVLSSLSVILNSLRIRRAWHAAAEGDEPK